jgi:endo-1,3(4)-beta-glucanase
MMDAMKEALQKDLLWRLPQNYLAGAGDTYFSGKLLARLARILIIADEMGLSHTSDFNNAVVHLREATEIWLNGSAQSVFLYDQSWRGVIMCGCNYAWDEEKKLGYCANKFPDCPALSDMGQNFGAGFYNDHHYHFGYHIYAAAVVSKFDANWGRKFHERVLLLVRDIANPSNDDPYFPTWRHKDWYLGFSWASGIVTIGSNQPYPNGRNQESVSEAIAAYEAVAMYGDVMSNIYFGSDDRYDLTAYDSALRMRDMGRLLMATEIRSAKIYWHVQSPDTPGVSRIYPGKRN